MYQVEDISGCVYCEIVNVTHRPIQQQSYNSVWLVLYHYAILQYFP